MVPATERSLPGADFVLPIAERPRALWARAQRALKEFLVGEPEDALLAASADQRSVVHVALFALLTLPLAFAWLPGGAVGRWAALFSLLSGLAIATRLESAQHARANPLGLLAVSALYALSLTGVAAELLGPDALRVLPAHWLAGVVVVSAFLATRSDPRLCLLASVVGVASLAARVGLAEPALLVVAVAAGAASTLAAARGRALRRLGMLDTASGALNASAFANCLSAAELRASERSEPLMLARIRFAALHAIRETHGAALAEALLRWLAHALIDRFRATDLLARTGEDEFTLALQATDHPGVERRLERLCAELATLELSRDGLREPIALRVAFGLAAVPREAGDVDSAQRLAAQRLALAQWRSRQLA